MTTTTSMEQEPKWVTSNNTNNPCLILADSLAAVVYPDKKITGNYKYLVKNPDEDEKPKFSRKSFKTQQEAKDAALIAANELWT